MDEFKLAQEKGIGGVGVKGFMPYNSTKDGKIKVDYEAAAVSYTHLRAHET